MPQTSIDRTVEIDAPPFKVWDVLTKPEYNARWAPALDSRGPFRIESDWRVGAPVLWKDEDGQIVVEGNVTRIEPEKLVRFTAFDTRLVVRPATADEDGITFELSQRGGGTVLHLRQTEFPTMQEGGAEQLGSAQGWERALRKIKEVAEEPTDAV